MYYVLLPPELDRQAVLNELKRQEIFSVFHYVSLHSSPAGKRYGRVHGAMSMTEQLSERLIRLPLWVGISEAQQERVVSALTGAVYRSI